MDQDLKSKFIGTLYGLSLGDAIGSFFEGLGSVTPEQILKCIEQNRVLRYTDDTEMTIGVAESLVKSKGVHIEDMVKTFIRNFDPSRGYGWGTMTIINLWRKGEDWREVSKRMFGGAGSFGNGAAMRVAPLALMFYDRTEKLRCVVEEASRITHAHPLGIEGAILQAFSIALSIKVKTRVEVDPKWFLENLQYEAKSEVFRVKIEAIHRLLDLQPSKNELRSKLGCGVESYNSVPAAIYFALKYGSDYRTAVLNAVSLGGDTDTIGSMTGAIVGAHLGLDAIPTEWVSKLENAPYIRELAEKLLEIKIGMIKGLE